MSLLYKFQDWSSKHGKKILTEKSIYFSSFKDFNDPFDSDILLDYENLTPEEEEKIIYRHVDYDHPHLNSFERKLKFHQYYKASALGDAEELKKNYEEIVRPANQNEIGIFCLTKNKSNILLWSHYANSHTGYCVGFDKEYIKQLSDDLLFNEDFLTYLDEVEYQDSYPTKSQINPADDDPKTQIRPLFIKSKHWSYEEEVRLIVKDLVNESITIPKEAIKEVTLGLNFEEKNDKEEIIELIKSSLPKTKIYQAKKAEREFALTFSELK